jgi:glycosyltransferase involved in cell wall biosynthesis
MRVLMITNFFLPGHLGGAELAAYQTSLGLREAGHDVRVLSINTRASAFCDEEYTVAGVPTHEVTLVRRWRNRVQQMYDREVAAYVEREVVAFRPDVIHTHNLSGTSLAPFVVAGRARVPLVATLHDLWLLCANNMLMRRDHSLCSPREAPCGRCFRQYDYWAPLPARRRVFRLLTRHVHRFISPSRKLIDLHVAGGYSRERFTLLRHGLYPLPRPPAGAPPVIGQHYVGAPSVVFVGSVVVSKGVEVLGRAFPRAAARIPGLRLVVAGRGPEAQEARLRDLGDQVVMLGQVPRTHIAEVYAGAGLLAAPSTINENSPLSVCESLMAGTPVVAARIGGIPELIVEGETGYLYEPQDADGLADAIIRHFHRPPRELRAMRRACVEYGKREFSVTMHVERLVEIYETALLGKRETLA